MKRFVNYILICLLVVTMMPANTFALDTEEAVVESERIATPPDADILTPQEQLPEQTNLDANREGIVSIIAIEQKGTEEPVAPPVVVAPHTVIANDAVLVSAVQFDTSGLSAVELKNTSDKPIKLDNRHLEVVYSDGRYDWSCEVGLSGYMLTRVQTTFVAQTVTLQQRTDSPSPYFVEYTCAPPQDAQLEASKVIAVDFWNQQEMIEHVRLEGVSAGVWVRKGTGATNQTGIFLTDFKAATTYEFTVMDLYYPPHSNPLSTREVYVNPQSCAPSDLSAFCRKYIKLTNTSDDAVDLSLYRLRAGLPETNATTANTSILSGVVAPHETVLLQKTSDDGMIYLASSEGTVWFQDKYGLQDYYSDVAPYSGAGNVGNKGLSWALDDSDGQWKWSLPSPYSVMNDIRLPTLKEVKVTVSSLAPCKDGQYRSEETNRCRNIALAGSTLVACKDNQYRSEETNRCRSIVTASTNLVPCKDNQYRSEETNRCRNVAATAIPEAAFAVTPVQETGKAFIGWWALGGVGLLAVGYGAWEWRREVATGIRKVSTFFAPHR